MRPGETPGEILRDSLSDAPGPVTVLTHGLHKGDVAAFGLPDDDARVQAIDGGCRAPQNANTVVLAVRDRQALRRAASMLPDVGRVRRVICWVKLSGGWAPVVVPKPNWPRIEIMSVGCERAGVACVQFAGRVAARKVLLEFARHCTSGQSCSPGRPVVGVEPGAGQPWPTADAATLRLDPSSDVQIDQLIVPPDVVVATGAYASESSNTASPVTGRAPVAITFEPPLTWDECSHQSAAELLQRLRSEGKSALGGLDEQLLNPVGFRREHDGTISNLVTSSGSAFLSVECQNTTVSIDTDEGVTEADVSRLRDLQALRVGWRGGAGPHGYAKTIAALAMAGIPLVTDSVPSWARLLLDRNLVAELERPADVRDPLRREETSVRQRRAALNGHASRVWRRDLAERHGLPSQAAPRVSVLLVTRRPEMVDFAVRQVARQRAAVTELVLVTHGFGVDPCRVTRVAETAGISAQVAAVPADLSFGMALNLAASRSTGDLLVKMDDDDWYGPEFVSDLLLAKTYSGAELVGVPSEFTFLRPLWLTVRRPDLTEQYRPWVAGGTIMIDRSTFAAVGGFRPLRRYVDASLLSAVLASGASVYRAHGLGYMLHRAAGGHTWDPGLGYFLDSRRVAGQWRGFAPSALLDPEPIDLPTREGASLNAWF